MAACPYDAIFITRKIIRREVQLLRAPIDVGLEPACVVVLPDSGHSDWRHE